MGGEEGGWHFSEGLVPQHTQREKGRLKERERGTLESAVEVHTVKKEDLHTERQRERGEEK